jgi:hypothetical protein
MQCIEYDKITINQILLIGDANHFNLFIQDNRVGNKTANLLSNPLYWIDINKLMFNKTNRCTSTHNHRIPHPLNPR